MALFRRSVARRAVGEREQLYDNFMDMNEVFSLMERPSSLPLSRRLNLPMSTLACRPRRLRPSVSHYTIRENAFALNPRHRTGPTAAHSGDGQSVLSIGSAGSLLYSSNECGPLFFP
jgi:hypothetical protein